MRTIEILPGRFSKRDFRRVIKVTEEFVEKNLVGSKDFTFVDITEHPIPKVTPLPANADFPKPSKQETVKPMLEKATENSTKNFLTTLCSFPHRRSNRAGSQDSTLWIKAQIENVLAKLPEERRRRFKIELVDIRRYIQDSIIVTFEGDDAEQKDTHVLFGAHIDDVGHNQAGADDNGSSSATAFESFKVIAESSYSPKKTIGWMFYSAEESGLVGSYQIANDWKSKGKKVLAHLNYDMTGNQRAGTPLKGRRLTLNTTPKFTKYMGDLSKEYTKIEIDEWRFSGGSDHIPWTRAGYSSACLTEREFSPHYHKPSDKVEYINFELVTEFARLAIAYLVELS